MKVQAAIIRKRQDDQVIEQLRFLAVLRIGTCCLRIIKIKRHYGTWLPFHPLKIKYRTIRLRSGPCSLGIGSKGRRGAASSDEEQFVRVTGGTSCSY
ncbi:MAG: hypothetical protein ACRD4W_02825 [Nitrososphaeraceae archaeon]